jgi:predicted nucleic acid-binding protein
MIVAVDACAIIYLVEARPPLGQRALDRVRSLMRDDKARMLCSRLARLECRVGPLRAGDESLLARYHGFFVSRRVVVADVNAVVIERATHLRARHGFKTPDAVHLATAIEGGADVFLTGDSGLARCPGLRVELLGERLGP